METNTENPAVTALLNEIERHDEDIVLAKNRGREAKSGTYYLKGKALVKLSKLIAEQKTEFQNQALNSFKKAIELESGKAKYYVELSKLYVDLGDTATAINNMRMAEGLPKDGVEGKFVINALRDMHRLDQINDKVQKLKENNQISDGLANVLTEHINVSTGLVVQVGTHGEKLEQHEEKFTAHDDRIARLEAQLQKMAETSEKEKKELELKFVNENKILKAQLESHNIAISGHDKLLEEHKTELDALNTKVAALVDKLDNLDYEQLEKVIDKSCLEENEQKLLDTIEADLCKQSFYNSLRWQMNSLYLAATVITTDMVANQKTGTMGTVGGVLKTLADYTPIAGMAVKLLGEILVGVDAVDQKIKLEIYSKLVTDSNEMSILSEKIARKLAFDLDKINIKTGKPEQIFNKAQDVYDNKVVQAAYNVASSDTGSAAGSVYDMMKNGLKKVKAYRKSTDEPKLTECVKRFVSDNYDANSSPESRAIADGEKKAKIIVKYIVGQIFAENIEDARIDKLVENITENVEQHYSSASASEIKSVHMLFEVEYDNPQELNNLFMKHYDPVTAGLMELMGTLKTAQSDNLCESDNLG